jgi:hypothetical protein
MIVTKSNVVFAVYALPNQTFNFMASSPDPTNFACNNVTNQKLSTRDGLQLNLFHVMMVCFSLTLLLHPVRDIVFREQSAVKFSSE